eukprot:g1218.t1
MVLDPGRFTPNKPLLDETFMVLEQLPGKVYVRDESAYLQENRYWGSYNVPAFPEVWKQSGFGDGKGPAWQHSHRDCPRAQIMRRLNSTVNDIDGFKRMIRFNNATESQDPHQAYAGYGISGRFDLLGQNQSGYGLSGGIDGKATSVNLIRESNSLKFFAQNGPTHDAVSPFDWTTAGPFPNPAYEKPPTHLGMPDRWEFEWIPYDSADTQACAN